MDWVLDDVNELLIYFPRCDPVAVYKKVSLSHVPLWNSGVQLRGLQVMCKMALKLGMLPCFPFPLGRWMHAHSLYQMQNSMHKLLE
jgi:hypothetical protein